MSHPLARVLVVVVLLFVATGCVPEEPVASPEPSPVFTNEAEAFAAAEETYRAYVDALNQVDLADPATFEPVFDLTTGDANAGARKTFSQMHADGWVVAGETRVSSIGPVEGGVFDARTVAADVCLDVSGVTLVGPDGVSVVDADRRDVQSMRVSFEAWGAPVGARIVLIDGREDGVPCES